MTDESTNWFLDDAATLGDRLSAARDAAGMSAETLAATLGVKTATLESWENDRKEPRANRLQMLTGILGVSLRWLMTGVGDGPDRPDHREMDADVAGMLRELRELRAQITQTATQMGQLEKRLGATLRWS